MRTIFKVKNMNSLSCKLKVEDIALATPGVLGANVNLGSGRLSILHDRPLDLPVLKARIESSGDYLVQ